MLIHALALAIGLMLSPGPQVVHVAPGAAPGATGRVMPAFRKTDGPLFDNVVAILRERYYDEAFRTTTLPGLVEKYRRRATAAATLADQRQAVHDLLSEVPASHLGLLSARAFDMVTGDLQARPYPNFGFQLIASSSPGGYYASFVLENGPAARAGLLPGDRIRSIDGVAPQTSPRFEWRSDDAYLKDDRDPAVHALSAAAGDRIVVEVERRPGENVRIEIAAEEYTPLDAARASARTIRRAGACLGYVHFWYVHMSGVPALIEERTAGDFKACGALIVDLRGRGGSLMEVPKIIAVIRAWRDSGRAVVALVDRQSRSGKDILAYEMKEQKLARLVGEPTAGAVVPAMFADVGHDTILMFPASRVNKYSELLEFKPVTPDVAAPRPGMFAAGRDPILLAGIEEAFTLTNRQKEK